MQQEPNTEFAGAILSVVFKHRPMTCLTGNRDAGFDPAEGKPTISVGSCVL
jgi:hypothetical protein